MSKSYGEIHALDEVSLRVGTGEFVALLGPNGAGKSTLMQILSGLFPADDGTASVLGYDIGRELTRALSRLGVVFQMPTLDLEISVERNLLYHAGLHGMPRADARERIETLLSHEGLLERRRERAGNLSGGNRRRVELVRAMLHAPRLLLMDEATVGLDPVSRQDLLHRILRLRGEGIGVLWTTHLVDEAERADRVAILHRGRIRFDGPPAELLSETRTRSIGRAFFEVTGVRPATE